MKSFLQKTITKTREVVKKMLSFGPSMLEKPANRTFFFGYGSLMYPQGINGRGMKKHYDKSDLQAASLKGFSRGLTARSWNGYLYYGVSEDETSQINGVIFEVEDNYDYTRLMVSEGAHPMYGEGCVYKLLEVTDKISAAVPSDARIFLVVPVSPTDIGYIPVEYVKRVWEGIQIWGKEFCDEFLRAGGRKYDRKIIEDQILYARRAQDYLKKRMERRTKNVGKRTNKNSVSGGRKL